MSYRNDIRSGVDKDALKVLYKSNEVQYRPRVFRQVLPVTVGGVPDYVRFLEVETMQGYARFGVTGQLDNTKPLASEDTSLESYQALSFQSAFTLLDDEIKAYAASGKTPSAMRFNSIVRAGEQLLDGIAANGYTSSALSGILNQSAAASPTDAQLFLDSSTLTRWDTAPETAANVCDQLIEMVQSVTTNSLQVHTANKIVLPLNMFQYAARVKSTVDNRTALELARASMPGVAIMPWTQCNDIGTNSTGRAIVMEASADVAEMKMVHELREEKRIVTHEGLDVWWRLKTAGVMVHERRGVEYWDFAA